VGEFLPYVYEVVPTGAVFEASPEWIGDIMIMFGRHRNSSEWKRKAERAAEKYWLGEAYPGGHKEYLTSEFRIGKQVRVKQQYDHNPAQREGRYCVWLLDSHDNPMSEGPYGPHDLQATKQYARISATEGDHDRVVSVGLDPDSAGFQIVRRYRRGTGERTH
jgi:hypothetical protein